MRRSHTLAVIEVLAASVFASTASYLFTLQMIKRYGMTVIDISWTTATACFGRLILWLLILGFMRNLPHRFFLSRLREHKISYEDFEVPRRLFDHTVWTVLAGTILIAGFFALILQSSWTEWPFTFGLPLFWLTGLRRLLALPEPTDKRYRFSMLADESSLSITPGSQELTAAETAEKEARDTRENR